MRLANRRIAGGVETHSITEWSSGTFLSELRILILSYVSTVEIYHNFLASSIRTFQDSNQDIEGEHIHSILFWSDRINQRLQRIQKMKNIESRVERLCNLLNRCILALPSYVAKLNLLMASLLQSNSVTRDDYINEIQQQSSHVYRFIGKTRAIRDELLQISDTTRLDSSNIIPSLPPRPPPPPPPPPSLTGGPIQNTLSLF